MTFKYPDVILFLYTFFFPSPKTRTEEGCPYGLEGGYFFLAETWAEV
jgi:hypothetical protein